MKPMAWRPTVVAESSSSAKAAGIHTAAPWAARACDHRGGGTKAAPQARSLGPSAPTATRPAARGPGCAPAPCRMLRAERLKLKGKQVDSVPATKFSSSALSCASERRLGRPEALAMVAMVIHSTPRDSEFTSQGDERHPKGPAPPGSAGAAAESLRSCSKPGNPKPKRCSPPESGHGRPS